jgi:uncharacterized protein YecE (DUF72 family)
MMSIRRGDVSGIPTSKTCGAGVGEKLHIGTSGFAAPGWARSFYPKGLLATEYLSYYAARFDTVELMSTLYGPPAASTVRNWYSQTPEEFVFAVKMPRRITHERALSDCSKDISDFFRVMDQLKEKLGPILFKFGAKDTRLYGNSSNFLERLLPLLKRLPHSYRIAVSVPAKWADRKVINTLRGENISLVFSDDPAFEKFILRERAEDLITSDFVYIRWAGDSRKSERRAKPWDRMIVDRHGEILEWVEIMRKVLLPRSEVFAYATNGYEGYAPGTAEKVCRLLKDKESNIGNTGSWLCSDIKVTHRTP